MPTTLFPTPRDYTAKDFDALYVRLRTLANSVFPEWTDFTAAGFGNLLIEMDAHTGDVINYYLDKHGAEAFFPTLVQRLSLIRLGRMVGYTLPGATAASGTLRFSIPVVDANPRTIAANTICRTRGSGTPVRFRVLPNPIGGGGWVIPAGILFIDALAEHSILTTETFTSTATPYVEVRLARTPYLDGSATVTAAEGTFTRVDSFLDADSNDLVYVVLVDQYDRAKIRFGDGSTGRIPTGTITVVYATGGGVSGNADADSIRVIEGSIADVWGTVPALANNPAAFTGGTDRTTVERGRYLAPRSLRSLTRTVSRIDFETNAELIPEVARALMATRNEDAAVAENTGRLYVVARGEETASGRTKAATPSAVTLAAVTAMVTTTRPPTLTFTVYVEAAQFATINVTARIYLAFGATAAATKTAIEAAIDDLFAPLLADGTPNPMIDFGAHLLNAAGVVAPELPWDKVFNAIHDAAGVRKVDEGASGLLLNSLRQSVAIEPREFPLLGTVTLYDATTGLVL